jgi:O-antigen ligase
MLKSLFLPTSKDLTLFSKIARDVFLFGALVVFVTLPWAKSLSSFGIGIAVGIGFIYSMANLKELTKEDKGYVLIFGLLYLLGVISYFYSENTGEAAAKLFLKLPLLLLPFSLPLVRILGQRRRLVLLISFLSVVFLNAFFSTIHYFLHFEELNELVLHAKPIPILGKIYHIQFSVFNALSIFIGVYLYTIFKGSKWKYLFLLLAGANFVMLHILAARTGIFSFYLTAGVLLLYFTIKHKSMKGFFVMGAMVLSLVAAYFFSTSFRNRIYDTKKDLMTYVEGTYPNHYSNTQRIMAFKTAWKVFGVNTLKGVGIGDVHIEMLKQYKADNSPLLLETRKKPHNQFLELGLQSGLLSILLLLLIFLLPLRKNKHILLVAFLMLFFVSMQFESMLERQASLYVFALIYVVLVPGHKEEGLINS